MSNSRNYWLTLVVTTAMLLIQIVRPTFIRCFAAACH